MDTTLTVNPGSSSKKYALFQKGKEIFSVLFERTGEGFGKCVEVNGVRERCEDISATAFDASIPEVLEIACREGVIRNTSDITRVAVRIVAPGTFFLKHRLIDVDYLKRLDRLCAVAPLHIPVSQGEVRAVMDALPDARVCGISDSAFHAHIPSYARTYSIPEEDTTELDIYRFGYHGLSVASVQRQVRETLGRMPERMIVCHIGSGVSVTALREGESIDTSMGFSPGSGLMMNTRAGDIDPGALFYLIREKGLSDEDAEHYINEKCGLKGVLGNSDLRIALDRMTRGEVRAVDAVRMYFYRIQKIIGGFVSALGGLDMLVLTATAVERNPMVRSLLCDGLHAFGVELDSEINDTTENRAGVVSSRESTVEVRVVLTDEMQEMAMIADSL